MSTVSFNSTYIWSYKKTKICLGSQDCHYKESGAFTGESSIELLKKFKCKYVILGHSERREYNAETNSVILKKIQTAFNHGLKPIICIGEPINLRKKQIFRIFRDPTPRKRS